MRTHPTRATPRYRTPRGERRSGPAEFEPSIGAALAPSPHTRWPISVSTTVGHTELARMPYGPVRGRAPWWPSPGRPSTRSRRSARAAATRAAAEATVMIEPAVPWRTMCRADRRGEQRGCPQVHGDRRVEQFAGSVSMTGCGMGDPGVVHQDVEPAERLGGAARPARRGPSRSGEIDWRRVRSRRRTPPTARSWRPPSSASSRPLSTRRGARRGECPGEVGADSLGGAGDQRALAVEAHRRARRRSAVVVTGSPPPGSAGRGWPGSSAAVPGR